VPEVKGGDDTTARRYDCKKNRKNERMSVILHFRKSGHGAPLVILHGLYGASDNWISIARKLEGQFTVFIPDLRNHGHSPHIISHTYQDMVDDLFQFFKDHQINKAIILGHSMGGKLAMMFASEYPELVENLIVADIAPKSYNSIDKPYKTVLQHEIILGLMEELNLVAVSSRKEIDHFLSEKLKDSTLRQFLIKNIHRNKDDYFEWKINVPVLKYALHSITSEVSSEWFAGRTPILNYPVTFIRGLNSDYISDDDIPVIKEIYPEARVIGIPGAGHWLHAEQPEKFVEAILSSI
jgi:pimeloyl-ACP methyl ester carboxylesterase